MTVRFFASWRVKCGLSHRRYWQHFEWDVIVVCGNHDGAKSDVKAILDQFGFDVADMGGARAIEPLCITRAASLPGSRFDAPGSSHRPGAIRCAWLHAGNSRPVEDHNLIRPCRRPVG
jgi:hypothetical protein